MPAITASMLAMHRTSPLWTAFADGMSAQDLKASTATMTGDVAKMWLEKGHRYGMLRKARKGRHSVYYRTEAAPSADASRMVSDPFAVRPLRRTPWAGLVVHRRGGWTPGTGGYGTDIGARS